MLPFCVHRCASILGSTSITGGTCIVLYIIVVIMDNACKWNDIKWVKYGTSTLVVYLILPRVSHFYLLISLFVIMLSKSLSMCRLPIIVAPQPPNHTCQGIGPPDDWPPTIRPIFVKGLVVGQLQLPPPDVLVVAGACVVVTGVVTGACVVSAL